MKERKLNLILASVSDDLDAFGFNKETRGVIEHALAEEQGLVPDDSIAFDNIDDATAFLESL